MPKISDFEDLVESGFFKEYGLSETDIRYAASAKRSAIKSLKKMPTLADAWVAAEYFRQIEDEHFEVWWESFIASFPRLADDLDAIKKSVHLLVVGRGCTVNSLGNARIAMTEIFGSKEFDSRLLYAYFLKTLRASREFHDAVDETGTDCEGLRRLAHTVLFHT